MTADDLLKLEIIDEVVPEPLGGAHREPEKMAETLKQIIIKHIKALKTQDKGKLLELRYQKFRSIGRLG